MVVTLTLLLTSAILIVNPSIVGVGSAALIVALVWCGRREAYPFNPYYLFLLTPISLLLYAPSVSARFIPELSVDTQLMIVAGNFAYLGGLLSVRGFTIRFEPQKRPRYSFFLILVLGLIPHALGILAAGVPLLANDVNAARAAYAIPILGQFNIFLPLAIIVAFQMERRDLVLLSIVLNLFFSIIVVAKFNIMFVILYIIFAYFRYDGKNMFKIRPLYLVLVVLFCTPFIFSYIFAARTSLDQWQYNWWNYIRFGNAALDALGNYLYLPYLYLTAPWSNFSYVIEIGSPYTFGARLLHPLLSVFQMDWLLDIPPKGIRNEGWNTYAYLADFYLDFGVAGIILLPYLLGAAVKWAYARAHASGDAMDDGIWVNFAFASFTLFFSNHFTTLSYVIVALLLFNVVRVSRLIFGLNRPGQPQMHSLSPTEATAREL